MLDLADSRSLRIDNSSVISTPLLIPAFSSKGFQDPKRTLAITEEVITDAILLSAYDLFYHQIDFPKQLPELIYIDSGGYEATKDSDFADSGYMIYEPVRPWSEYFYIELLENLPCHTTTVFVSFDHPNCRYPIEIQIEKAYDLFRRKDNILKTLLIKPENTSEPYVNLDSLLRKAKLLEEFDIIGIADKELGSSVLTKMLNIANLRIALNELQTDLAIHIFGSLDTISAPLYFLSGADIFDGLSWQRFAYKDGSTIYKQNYYPLDFKISEKDEVIEARTWFKNIYYLNDLRMQMNKFITSRDFLDFKYIGTKLKQLYDELQYSLGEVRNGW